jgi:hypothetical protein
MTPALDLALKYSRLGWQTFQLKARDKVPAVKWADVATVEENQLLGWWEFNPAANLGIATGKRSGIVVLDIDKDKGGYDSLVELQDKYGRLPLTPVSKTGSGGEHIFFVYPEHADIRNSAGKLGAGLDVRGNGGYVVAPPSIHPNGTIYEWVVLPSQTPLAEMPEWLIDLLHEKKAAQVATTADGKIPDGSRNDTLVKMAGSMRRKGFDNDSIFLALRNHNTKHCNPPLPDGEVYEIAESIGRYAPEPQKQPPALAPSAWDVIEALEADIQERQKNPKEVWGIHYPWEFLSILTGGKQPGELTILAGEPGVGKSWFAHQDALFSAIGGKNIPSTPSLIWCGEMPRRQVFRRFFEMLGVPKRHMLTGNMSAEDWQTFNEAKALIVNSPIYVVDKPLDISDVRPLLEREQAEHGIEQGVFDYDWLISAPGANEIATSQNISRAFKIAATELNLSLTLVSSVNKTGMDSSVESLTNVSGSGKKLHDADIIFLLTKFNSSKNADDSIMPIDYDRIATLHIKKGRELDYRLPDGALHFIRETPRPTFKELKPFDRQSLPEWMRK